MKIFLKHIGEFLHRYPQVRLTRKDEISIREATMKNLGLENLNHLRDRFEGQAFFEKTMMNIGGLMAIQKYLNLPIVEFKKINLKDFQPKLDLLGQEVNVQVFSFGTLPYINTSEVNKPIIFVIRKDQITFTLCGLATKDVLKNNLEEISIDNSSSKRKINFTGFKFLKSLDILETNNNLIN